MTAYRESKRQQAWAKAEAKRVIAQEQADALTALGVPCAQRSGWVVLLDPVGLRIKLDPSGAVTGWAAEPCARCGSTETRASIDGLRYCHGEQRPSCYELAQWESRGIVAAEATLPAVTAPDPEPHSGRGEPSDAAQGRTELARGGLVGTSWGAYDMADGSWYESKEPPEGYPLTLTIPEAGLQVPPL